MQTPAANNNFSFGPSEIKPEEIELIKPLGQGAFGTVWVGRCRSIEVAVKVPNANRRITQRQLEAFQAEVKIMSKIFHPNVALFMGASTSNPDAIRIVSELMAGDVERLIHDKKLDLPLYQRMKMAKDAAQGMAWLHGGTPVCLHRDFKTSNLLIDKNGVVKVCDFGLSQLFEKGQRLVDEKRPKGTPLYMAPEVWLGREFNEKADVYSFGVVLWELLKREAAFAHHNSIDEFKKAITVDMERPPIPVDCIPSLRDLMVRCWDNDPNKRPYFPEICDKLQEVLVESAIYDTVGRNFWKKCFLKKEWVSWSDFASAFGSFVGTALPPEPKQNEPVTEDILNMRCMKALLVQTHETEKEAVGIVRFGEILGWFGPVEQPTKSPGWLDKMRQIMSATFMPKEIDPKFKPTADIWFHGFLTLQQAEQMLKPKDPGTFIVRFSSNIEHPTWFAVSKVSADRKIRSVRIEHEPGSDWVVVDDQKRPHRFNSLLQLINEASFLHLKVACPGSPFQHLFAGVNLGTGYTPDYSENPV